MTTQELLQKISNGEDSFTQFKENIHNDDKLAMELVAFSNAQGGMLIVGVRDDGHISGLSKEDIQRINQLISNTSNTKVVPPLYLVTRNLSIQEKKVMTIYIQEGANKPYATNKGVYLTKAGSDKRKISPEELRRLFAET